MSDPVVGDERGPWIQSWSGRQIHVLDPRPEDVYVEDIAHALALTNRFGGHSIQPYSVAQHSIHVSRLVPPEYAMVGLLHDATEAFIGDVVRPLKHALVGYAEIEDRWAIAIATRLGLPERALVDLPDEVKLGDEVALATERRDVMVDGPARHRWTLRALPDSKVIEFVSWEHIENLFLARFIELGGRPT